MTIYLESMPSFSKTVLLVPSFSSAACSDLIARALKTWEVMEPLDVAVVDMIGDNSKLCSVGVWDETTSERSNGEHLYGRLIHG